MENLTSGINHKNDKCKELALAHIYAMSLGFLKLPYFKYKADLFHHFMEWVVTEHLWLNFKA